MYYFLTSNWILYYFDTKKDIIKFYKYMFKICQIKDINMSLFSDTDFCIAHFAIITTVINGEFWYYNWPK